MGKLEGKVALITGSDSGIGQGTAIEMAKEGARIVVTYHTDEKGAAITLTQVRETGSDGMIIQVDTSDEKSVDAMFDKALEKYDTIDILVNNAGIDASGIQVADMPTEVWDKAMRTNLYGYFFCCRRFINIRKQASGGGKILNITSVHDEIPRSGAADYDCAKGAVRNLTRTLALELAPLNINVNNIAPGWTLTPFNEEDIKNQEQYEKDAATVPLKRAAVPEEIGKLAVFLASSDADYVDGSTYVMDGGLMQNLGQGA